MCAVEKHFVCFLFLVRNVTERWRCAAWHCNKKYKLKSLSKMLLWLNYFGLTIAVTPKYLKLYCCCILVSVVWGKINFVVVNVIVTLFFPASFLFYLLRLKFSTCAKIHFLSLEPAANEARLWKFLNIALYCNRQWTCVQHLTKLSSL